MIDTLKFPNVTNYQWLWKPVPPLREYEPRGFAYPCVQTPKGEKLYFCSRGHQRFAMDECPELMICEDQQLPFAAMPCDWKGCSFRCQADENVPAIREEDDLKVFNRVGVDLSTRANVVILFLFLRGRNQFVVGDLVCNLQDCGYGYDDVTEVIEHLFKNKLIVFREGSITFYKEDYEISEGFEMLLTDSAKKLAEKLVKKHDMHKYSNMQWPEFHSYVFNSLASVPDRRYKVRRRVCA